MSHDPLYHTGHLVRRVQQLHVALWNRELGPQVSSVQFAALVAIAGRPGISQAELGSRLDLDRSTIADLVERMAARGLILREKSVQDRRRKTLALTADGAALLDDMRSGVDRVQELMTEGLSADELAEFRRLLRKMLAHGVANGHLQGAAPGGPGERQSGKSASA